MTVNNKFVLLFKAPKEDSDDLFEKCLIEENYKVGIVDTLSFRYVNLELIKESLDQPDNYSGLILSSPRCVKALREALKGQQLDIKWKTLNNFVVGHGTYNSALKCLGLDCEGRDSGNGEALSDIIISKKFAISKPLFSPQSNIATDTIASKLLQNNILYKTITAYETVPNKHIKDEFLKLTNNAKDLCKYVVFFSPSGVKASSEIIDIMKHNNQINVLAIGPTTQKCLEELQIRVTATCQKPTPDSLINVIKEIDSASR